MLNLEQVAALTAIISTAIVWSIIIIKQKRLDKKDLGTIGATFFAGYNLPVAIFLCYYIFDPDPPELLAKTKLSGMHKYLCFSGIGLLYLSSSTIWGVIQSSFKTGKNS